MKIVATALITTSLLAGLAGADSASARDKQRKKHVAHKRAYVSPANADSDGYGPNRQVSYDINTLPFGSKLWWEQYLRTSGGSQGGGDGGGGGGGH
jgi:hypothetical protein